MYMKQLLDPELCVVFAKYFAVAGRPITFHDSYLEEVRLLFDNELIMTWRIVVFDDDIQPYDYGLSFVEPEGLFPLLDASDHFFSDIRVFRLGPRLNKFQIEMKASPTFQPYTFCCKAINELGIERKME